MTEAFKEVRTFAMKLGMDFLMKVNKVVKRVNSF